MCPFWNIILALHFYLLYNQLLSSFDAIPVPLLALWPLLPACRSLLYHPEQIKIPCPPLLLQNISQEKNQQGTLLRSYARSEAHSKRWSGSVNKAWESTTHVLSSGMLLRSGVPSQVLPVEWAGVSCYLSHSLQKHTSHRKIKHSPHFVTSSSSFSPLCSPSVLPVSVSILPYYTHVKCQIRAWTLYQQ